MTPRAWLAFAAVSVLWGIPYFLMKVAVADVSPGVVAWARLLLGAAILLPLAWRRGALQPAWKRLRWVAFVAVVYMAIPWFLIPLGETFISSSLAAIIVAGVPLAVVLMSLRRERPHPLRLLGLFAGLGGVALMVGIDVAGRPGELIGTACLLAVVVAYALGPIVISRKLGDVDQLGAVALALGLGALVETVPAVLTLPHRVPSTMAMLSLLGLGVLCTAIAMVAFFFLIAEAGPGRATVVTYVNPLVAVVLGVLALGERFTLSTAAGGALVLAGSWLATRAPQRERAPAVAPAPGRLSGSTGLSGACSSGRRAGGEPSDAPGTRASTTSR